MPRLCHRPSLPAGLVLRLVPAGRAARTIDTLISLNATCRLVPARSAGRRAARARGAAPCGRRGAWAGWGVRACPAHAKCPTAFLPWQKMSRRCLVTPRCLPTAARMSSTPGWCPESRIACLALRQPPPTAFMWGDPVGSPNSRTSPPQPPGKSPATAARCCGALSATTATLPNLRCISRRCLTSASASNRPCVRKNCLPSCASAPNAANLPWLPVCGA